MKHLRVFLNILKIYKIKGSTRNHHHHLFLTDSAVLCSWLTCDDINWCLLTCCVFRPSISHHMMWFLPWGLWCWWAHHSKVMRWVSDLYSFRDSFKICSTANMFIYSLLILTFYMTHFNTLSVQPVLQGSNFTTSNYNKFYVCAEENFNSWKWRNIDIR